MGVRPLAEHRRVGDEPGVLTPHMELIAGRFVHEPQRRLSGAFRSLMNFCSDSPRHARPK